MNKTNEILKELIMALYTEGYGDLGIVSKVKDHLNVLKNEVPLLSPIEMVVWNNNGTCKQTRMILGKIRDKDTYLYMDNYGVLWDNAELKESKEDLLTKLKEEGLVIAKGEKNDNS